MKKTVIFFVLVNLLLILFLPVNAYAAYSPGFELNSNIGILINLDSDTVVFEKNSDASTDPSSLTKVVTTILALEHCEDKDLNEIMITVPDHVIDNMAGKMGKNVNIKKGEILSMRQLLLCTMVHSSNDSSNVIADYVAGSVEAFVEMMNEFVKKVGCKNTVFKNAHGLAEEGQTTTARDMCLIGKYAMNLPEFMEIANEINPDTLKIPATNLSQARQLVASNYIIKKSSKYYYEYASGIKNGNASDGSKSLMTTATKDGYNYLCVIMEAPAPEDSSKKQDDGSMIDAKALFQWAFSAFNYKTVVKSSQIIAEVPVELAWNTSSLQLVPEKELSALVPSKVDESNVIVVKDESTLPESVKAPINKGDVIGQASVMMSGKEIARINLVAAESVEKSNTLYYLSKLKDIFSSTLFKIALLAVAALIILYIVVTIIQRKRRRSFKTIKGGKYKGGNFNNRY